MLPVSDKTYPKSLKSMKEVTFIRRNIEKWKGTEKVVEQAANLSPDQLADAYTELTADLAFAQTHFPTSRITIYLNNLASALHNEIYRSKREKWTRIITFWTREVPQTMHDARRELLISFIIFAVSALIGAVSAANDQEFVRLIMGNQYVDMTLDNIARGEPMAVYNGSPEAPMFLGITINNIKVSFLCFAAGILTSFWYGAYTSSEWNYARVISDVLLSARPALGVGTCRLAARNSRNMGDHRSRCCRTCFGQRLVVSRHLFETRIFP